MKVLSFEKNIKSPSYINTCLVHALEMSEDDD